MATKTDLQGFLWQDGERNVQLSLADWLGQEVRPPPITVRARWTPCYASSSEKVGEVKFDTPNPAASNNVVEELYEQICEKLGSAPDGTLRVQIHEKGSSGKPGINMQARITPPTGFGEDPNLGLLQRENQRLQRENMEMHARHVEWGSLLAGIVASQAQQIAQLGTMRSVSSGMADASSNGFYQLIGLFVLAVGYPVARRRLGLTADATLDDMVERASAMFMRGSTSHEGNPDAPDMSHTRPALPQGSVPADDAAADLPQIEQLDTDSILDALRRDPSLIDSVARGLMTDPELSKAAQAAVMGG